MPKNKQTILIITNGTRGDIEPFISLAMGLQKIYHVIICAPEIYKTSITCEGLGYAYMNNGLPRLATSPDGRAIMEGYVSTWRYLRYINRASKPLLKSYLGQIDETYRAIAKHKPDLIIFNHVSIYSRYVANIFDIPVIFTLPSPALVPTSETSHLLFPQIKIGKIYNKATYHIILWLVHIIKKRLLYHWQKAQKKKKGQGFIAPPDNSNRFVWQQNDHTLVLHHYSQHISPPPKDWKKNIKVVGYWFRQKKNPWSPPASLVQFLKDKPKPIYIGFGSMAGTHKTTKKITKAIKELLYQTNHRLIVSTGWSDIDWRAVSHDKTIAKKIYFIKDAPHDWLFPKVSAAIHHGGAGTTAASIKAGCPTIVCPFFADQIYWANRVKKLQLGVSLLSSKKITSTALAKAINQAIDDPTIKANVTKIARLINNENGVKTTVNIIKEFLAKS